MASIIIRNLDDALADKLRLRAVHRNHSIEDEVRDILRSALAQKPEPDEVAADESTPAENLAAAIRRRIEPLGGVELTLPARRPMSEPPDFA